MIPKEKTAILVVSFGTTNHETYSKTIAVIEKEIQEKYSDYIFYSAWTSSMVRKIVEKRDNKLIFNVTEALNQIHKDGISQVVIQPTHIIDGIENTIMKNDIDSMRDSFSHIAIGNPLLTTHEDIDAVTDILIREWNLSENETLVYVGHGSKHASHVVYHSINEKLAEKHCSNIILGTMQETPSIEDVVKQLKEMQAHKVLLAPFMIVAGSHAHKELAGDETSSWKSILTKEGFEVQCILKGLGEYPKIRKLFIQHIENALKQ